MNPLETHIGELFDGRYRLERRIGHGGMADVFLARDELLGRQVAIKVLAERFARDAAFVERFRREASAAAGLSHPSIVGIYDRGEADGSYYIAMEYVDGGTLKEEIVRRAPFSQQEAIEIASQVASALAVAHRRGIVHRDIKPQNIMLGPDGQVKVTDFGIARAQGTDGMTEVGSIVGTAQYLAPEQARGVGVGPASDVYSLGIVLFEMLTGRLPFSGGSAVDIAMQQVTAQPPRPRAINPRIGPQVEAVIMRALAKDPAHRYADAGELLADLRRVGGGRNPSQETQQATRVMAAASPAAAVAGEAYARTGVLSPPVPPPAPEKRRRGAWPWILLALLLVALAAIGYVAYSELIGNRVEIPDVRGRTQARAVRILENQGLQVETRTEQSDQIADGRAIGTEPAAGQEVSDGSTVVLIVSGGPSVFDVPDVSGMTYDDARAEIERLGLIAEQGADVDSPTVEEGLVVRTQPRAGAQVSAGDTVTVFVSSGNVEVPDLVSGGLTVDGAAAALEDAGLARGDVFEQSSDTAPEGIVIGQGIEAGTVVAQGTTVDITVSTGPELVEVPDVRTQTFADGVAALQEAGFEVRVAQGLDPPPEAIIVGQQPNEGERPLGATIVLFVALPEQPPDGGGEGGGDGGGDGG